MISTKLGLKKDCPRIVCFYANYSGSCHLMHPMIEDLKDDYGKDIEVVLVEKGKNKDLELQYDIKEFPTILILCVNDELIRLNGLVNRDELYRHINYSLNRFSEMDQPN